MKREAPASPVSGRGEHAEAAGDHSRPPGRRCRDRRTLTSAGEDFKPPASSHAAGGMQNGAAVLENSLGDSEKVNADLPYVPATARRRVRPRERQARAQSKAVGAQADWPTFPAHGEDRSLGPSRRCAWALSALRTATVGSGQEGRAGTVPCPLWKTPGARESAPRGQRSPGSPSVNGDG